MSKQVPVVEDAVRRRNSGLKWMRMMLRVFSSRVWKGLGFWGSSSVCVQRQVDVWASSGGVCIYVDNSGVCNVGVGPTKPKDARCQGDSSAESGSLV